MYVWFFQNLFKSPTTEVVSEDEDSSRTLEEEMNEFVQDNLREKNRKEIDDFMYKEHKILYEIEEYSDEIRYILLKTRDKYTYSYQAPEVKIYLSKVICKCIFLKKKKIRPEHWLSYINLQ